MRIGRLALQAAGNQRCHRLRISLDEVEPEVWWSVVASDILVPGLARVLVADMGWDGHHLHQFVADGMYFGPGDEEMSRFTSAYERVTLEQIARDGVELEWHDDFGGSWSHRVVAEWVGEPEQARVPVCLDGARACPPEDCGGTTGHADLPAAVRVAHRRRRWELPDRVGHRHVLDSGEEPGRRRWPTTRTAASSAAVGPHRARSP